MELPKRLINAAEKFKMSLNGLGKDEYGDYLLKATDGDDPNSQEVLKQGHKLKTWIDKLKQ